MKPLIARTLPLILCGVVLSIAPGCSPATESSSGLRLWVAGLPNPLAGDRPRSLALVNRWGQAGKTKTVYVKGEVVRLSPLLSGMAYEIQDDTGRILIRTPRQDVVLGETVHVKGVLRRQKVSVEGVDFGEAYLEEKRQVEK